MSQPKGKVPAHIKQNSFDHPGVSSRIILTLCEVEDLVNHHVIFATQ